MLYALFEAANQPSFLPPPPPHSILDLTDDDDDFVAHEARQLPKVNARSDSPVDPVVAGVDIAQVIERRQMARSRSGTSVTTSSTVSLHGESGKREDLPAYSISSEPRSFGEHEKVQMMDKNDEKAAVKGPLHPFASNTLRPGAKALPILPPAYFEAGNTTSVSSIAPSRSSSAAPPAERKSKWSRDTLLQRMTPPGKFITPSSSRSPSSPSPSPQALKSKASKKELKKLQRREEAHDKWAALGVDTRSMEREGRKLPPFFLDPPPCRPQEMSAQINSIFGGRI